MKEIEEASFEELIKKQLNSFQLEIKEILEKEGFKTFLIEHFKKIKEVVEIGEEDSKLQKKNNFFKSKESKKPFIFLKECSIKEESLKIIKKMLSIFFDKAAQISRLLIKEKKEPSITILNLKKELKKLKEEFEETVESFKIFFETYSQMISEKLEKFFKERNISKEIADFPESEELQKNFEIFIKEELVFSIIVSLSEDCNYLLARELFVLSHLPERIFLSKWWDFNKLKAKIEESFFFHWEYFVQGKLKKIWRTFKKEYLSFLSMEEQKNSEMEENTSTTESEFLFKLNLQPENKENNRFEEEYLSFEEKIEELFKSINQDNEFKVAFSFAYYFKEVSRNIIIRRLPRIFFEDEKNKESEMIFIRLSRTFVQEEAEKEKNIAFLVKKIKDFYLAKGLDLKTFYSKSTAGGAINELSEGLKIIFEKEAKCNFEYINSFFLALWQIITKELNNFWEQNRDIEKWFAEVDAEKKVVVFKEKEFIFFTTQTKMINYKYWEIFDQCEFNLNLKLFKNEKENGISCSLIDSEKTDFESLKKEISNALLSRKSITEREEDLKNLFKFFLKNVIENFLEEKSINPVFKHNSDSGFFSVIDSDETEKRTSSKKSVETIKNISLTSVSTIEDFKKENKIGNQEKSFEKVWKILLCFFFIFSSVVLFSFFIYEKIFKKNKLFN